MGYVVEDLIALAILMEDKGREAAAQGARRESDTWMSAADVVRSTEFKPKAEEPFVVDHSKTNPGLHRLHVVWAQDVVQVVNECLERLSDFSQIQPSIMAGDLHKSFAEIVATETSYQEAVWRVYIHQLLQREDKEDS